MDRRLSDGSTYRDSLESVERQTGKRPADLEVPPLPHYMTHVWVWFMDLSAARGSNGWGPNPIGYQDIAAWVALTGVVTRPPEIAAIMLIDKLWLSEQHKAAEATRGKRKAER